ncbi:BEN domain-containing protein 6-like isoform X3 [Alosa sapidissima]|nr:BEN domain-containing protein 6-like isoform X3 [Alosa sapidissima]XP_041946206.1 BEN domain-containing protein 6-like isoform X3 [Alosa sapidissima]
MKALEALERGCRNAATGTEERGRGLREKRPPAQFSPASSEEHEEDTNPKLKGKKNLTKALSLQFLNEYEESEPGYSRDVNPAADSSIANQLNEMRCLLLEMREKIINLERTVRDQITQPASSTLSRSSPLLPSSSSPSPPSRTTSSSPPPSRTTSSTSPPSPVQIHIGPTVKITATQYAHIKWSDPRKATKDLLMAVFGRQVLATHSYTGKLSNAFLGRQPKPQLNSAKTSDILNYITNKFGVDPALVKQAISQKCADEAKLARRRSK